MKLFASLAALALVAVACGGGTETKEDGPTIVVGSFGFGESEIIGEIYRQALEAEGYTVEHNVQIGPREIVKPALESGEIHIVPEYVGSALEVGFGVTPSGDGEASRDQLEELYEPLGVSVFGLAPGEDKNTYIVMKAFADQYDLESISDLAGVGRTIEFGGPPECTERPRCLAGLQGTYGLDLNFTALDAGGPLTMAALTGGEIELGLAFSTFVFNPDVVLLVDDLLLQPDENIVPVVNNVIIDAYGSDIEKILNAVNSKLTTADLAAMNKRFGVDKEDAADIAADWLADNG